VGGCPPEQGFCISNINGFRAGDEAWGAKPAAKPRLGSRGAFFRIVLIKPSH